MVEKEIDLPPLVRPTLAILNAEVVDLVTRINEFVDDDFEYQEKTRVWENMKTVREQFQANCKDFTDRCTAVHDAYMALTTKYKSHPSKHRKALRRIYESTKQKYELLAIFNDTEIEPIDEWEVPHQFKVPVAVQPHRSFSRPPMAVKLSRMNHNNKYRYHSRTHFTMGGAQRRITQLTSILRILIDEQPKRQRQWKTLLANIELEEENIDVAGRKLADAYGQHIWMSAFQIYSAFMRGVFRDFQREDLVPHPPHNWNIATTWSIRNWMFGTRADDGAQSDEASEDALSGPHKLIESGSDDNAADAPILSAATWTEGVLKSTRKIRNPSVRQPFGVLSSDTQIASAMTCPRGQKRDRVHSEEGDIDSFERLFTGSPQLKDDDRMAVADDINEEISETESVVNIEALNLEDEPKTLRIRTVKSATFTLEPRDLSEDDDATHPADGARKGMFERSNAFEDDSLYEHKVDDYGENHVAHSLANRAPAEVAHPDAFEGQIVCNSYMRPNACAQTFEQRNVRMSSSEYEDNDDGEHCIGATSPYSESPAISNTPDTPLETIFSRPKYMSSFEDMRSVEIGHSPTRVHSTQLGQDGNCPGFKSVSPLRLRVPSKAE